MKRFSLVYFFFALMVATLLISCRYIPNRLSVFNTFNVENLSGELPEQPVNIKHAKTDNSLPAKSYSFLNVRTLPLKNVEVAMKELPSVAVTGLHEKEVIRSAYRTSNADVWIICKSQFVRVSPAGFSGNANSREATVVP